MQVMCDPYTPAGVPIPTNKRHNAAKIFRHQSLPPRSLVLWISNVSSHINYCVVAVRKIHINWTIATKKNRITGLILSKEIKPLISTVFEGKDANVIAHGARNCGKTYLLHVLKAIPLRKQTPLTVSATSRKQTVLRGNVTERKD
ncbi:hypothetical protein ARALYDRAFT_891200 [Arabidopsis lyrata subsp. lyrata]|uniref:Uncharacterized protein n=1 Tax=Arabidopsis lyrata subsp. lyrata TaxID=81972 RepID=D7KL89_ARALL|nr:hypothetical protein ARALYDRAFT_891200 [Arabidopsis lyrata subsp. lyrata]